MGESEVPTQEFKELVKDALAHLYDFPYLQAHPLSQQSPAAPGNAGQTTGQRLRSELMAAIEQLSPGPGVPFRAVHARPYSLLQLHYIECMTIGEVAHALGISERQVYRDLRRAEDSVAAILWARRVEQRSPAASGAAELSSFHVEMARLEPRSGPCDVGALIRQAQKAVERLASTRGVSVRCHLPEEPVLVTTDPVPALQVLINLLSLAIRHALPGEVRVQLTHASSAAVICLDFALADRRESLPIANQVVTELLVRLGWRINTEQRGDGACSITISTLAEGPTVLVVDDNAGLVELLERYLTGHACRVLSASSGQQGLELARLIRPDAIVLDVMMPHMDGWELLQRLRAHALTAETPVIVCSVFDDPELAYSLGASLFLPKPIRRIDILNALRQLGVV